MSPIPRRLRALLDESSVEYEIIEHRPDYLAEQTALDTHTAAAEFAKTVVLSMSGEHALAVLPALYAVGICARCASSSDATTSSWPARRKSRA